MTTLLETSRAALSAKEWRVLSLLVISGFLNYVDRANLSVGATNIQAELHLGDYHLGMLLSAFFWTYATFQLFGIAGWLVDRFNVCLVLATGFFLWSGATAVTGAAHVFWVMFALRLVLGMGESVAYPSYSRILANNFPEHHRGFANALIDAGTKGGPALGTLLGGLLMARFGWRAFFLALGFGSLLWLVPWFWWMPRGRGVAAREHHGEVPSVAAILQHREAWFTALGLFCSNYFWYFLITWLPPYLEKERHFPKDKMAVTGSSAFLAISISAVISGWVSDRLIARGGTPTRVRRMFAGTGLVLSTIILPVCVVESERAAMGLLILACLSYGLYSSQVFAITQTLAGPRAAGKWTGLQNGFANLAGVVAPWLTGWVVQQTGQFYWAFVVAAAIVLASAAMFVFGIGRIEQVQFGRPAHGLQ
ncbi:MAG TPA: MFS transporter [Bryobacteraceae bacterium]|nr:MFS transporter [Bryobacteraceae bacterium]